jgi:type IV secretory pathway VirB2 component (pilin)
MPMRKMILIAFAGLSLSACGWMAQGEPQVTAQNGPYDNTANSLGGRFAGGIAGHR